MPSRSYSIFLIKAKLYHLPPLYATQDSYSYNTTIQDVRISMHSLIIFITRKELRQGRLHNSKTNTFVKPPHSIFFVQSLHCLTHRHTIFILITHCCSQPHQQYNLHGASKCTCCNQLGNELFIFSMNDNKK